MMHKKDSRTIVMAIGLLFSVISMSTRACEPCNMEDGSNAVKNAFDWAEVVLIATVASAVKSKQHSNAMGKDLLVEKVRFRVERVFKGKLKVGDYYYTETIMGIGDCGAGGISAVNDPVWLSTLDKNGKPAGEKISSQWLIYGTNGRVNRLQGCRTLPLEMAERSGDIDILNSMMSMNK